MKIYQKPVTHITPLMSEISILSGSSGTLITPIDDNNPATGPANSKGNSPTFETEEEEDAPQLW
ncbi:MAG TPA: toxin PIN [Prevotella sp.]|nr:toxin PIN [Prevotella sp.]